MTKQILTCTLLAGTGLAQAHGGHGLDSSHWHAAEVALLLAAVAVLAAWLAGRRA